MTILFLLKPKPWFWNITAADVDGWRKKRAPVPEEEHIELPAEIEKALELPAVLAQQAKNQQEEDELLMLLASM